MFNVGSKAKKGFPQTGKLEPAKLPYRGLNARSAMQDMPPEFGIGLVNVSSENNGLKTRSGYNQWALDLSGGAGAVRSLLYYWPADTSKGKLFAACGTKIYDVTVSGEGPYASTGPTGAGAWWNSVNVQTIAGSFLCCCNEDGGYSYYDGTTWHTPIMGAGVGQISGVDPATFCYVIAWKKRLWFVEKSSTRGWYLPVDQLTGTATAFDFGSQFPKGGYLVALADWTLDGGNGIDDKLVAVASMGDVAIYAGSDPASDFALSGVWNAGPLPTGRRCVSSTGGDVLILSQMGLVPVSQLIVATALPSMAQKMLSYNVNPLIAKLMRMYSTYRGWQLIDLPKEEMLLVGIPQEVGGVLTGAFFAYKIPTESWSTIQGTNYACLLNTGPVAYAGMFDGTVSLAFYGKRDGADLTGSGGNPIPCQVIPSYQALGTMGHNKILKLVRPTFLCEETPSVKVTTLVNYSGAQSSTIPTIPPSILASLWDAGIWHTATWGGLLAPLHNWYSCEGLGYAATPQIDYLAAGETTMTNIEFWVEEGNPL